MEQDNQQPTLPTQPEAGKPNPGMFRDMLFLVKHPYTAGIIATMWIGTAVIFLIERNVDIVGVILWTMVASLVVAVLGFRGRSSS